MHQKMHRFFISLIIVHIATKLLAIIFSNVTVLPTSVSYQSIDLPVRIDFLCIIQRLSRR